MNNSRNNSKIALGGGCHWCTEAVYLSLKGVTKVEQGFVASTLENSGYSEAIIVHFNTVIISMKDLIEIHLHTHQSTSEHSMRKKYRSSIYTFTEMQAEEALKIISKLQSNFEHKIITQVLPFMNFKFSDESFHNYYYSNPEKPFCKNYINPKLQLLMAKFSTAIDSEKFSSLNNQN